MKYGRIHIIGMGISAVMLVIAPSNAHAQKAQISGLSDVTFGTIANFSTDLSSSQNVCVYSSVKTTGLYSVTGTGSGSGGAFTLASGSNTLAYEVQWAASANQTSGTSLNPGVALTALSSSASSATCSSGPTSSASLITVLRTTNIQAANAGSYTGTLTLLVAPN